MVLLILPEPEQRKKWAAMNEPRTAMWSSGVSATKFGWPPMSKMRVLL